ncbi:MucB/RseB C-terminal domain-containing protein [Pseudomonas cannabina]|uniref:Sigma E regulatory protein, MucB/RseB n=1 Tax=Pseudomonas cannabina TaxID=86840 RepID=A0A0N8QWP6_PSECA|nr:MucB/RseB C-terminal domain-containing protein [Pseudomonas cannabina]KAA8705751.1 RNA polymerase subunit sigma [Pseudomonas cannabina]KPW70574.1 Sigma E regulatory protein, MucB/RseB [Pseudomonas cannabina]RMN26973.1 Sigma E regulatory protein, MucB/RseB [Pseudomonas cannabina]SDR25559.1 sigma E regulatory protein, MucB/RseB [Pseudomonas cannabina]
MRAVPLLPLLLSGWLALPVQADDAQDAINRLAKVDQSQSYQGAFVYERNGSFSTHRIWHRIADGKVQERLLQLDGSAQEVLRVGGLTQCVSGTLEAGVANPAVSTARAFDVKRLSAWYDMKIVGKSRVAGRPTTIVALAPKDQHRYGLELHLDNEAGLLLKSLLLSERGQLLERFQFTDLDTSSLLSEQTLKASDECKPVPVVKTKPEVAISPVAWRSDWLPPGFELSSSGVRKDPATQSSVTRLMYGDGLARFSVFIESVKGASSSDIRTQLGPTAAVSRRLTTPQGDMMVTVVGEVPMGTAERIALSMRNDETPVKQ